MCSGQNMENLGNVVIIMMMVTVHSFLYDKDTFLNASFI